MLSLAELMTHNLKNVFHAVTGNFQEIQDEPASGVGWPALLVGSVALGISVPAFWLIAVNQAVVCMFLAGLTLFASKGSKGVNFRRACIVLVAAPLPSFMFVLMEASPWLCWINMSLVSYWAVRAAYLHVPDEPVIRSTTSLDGFLDSADLRSLRASAATLFVEVGPVVAHFQGAEVPAWFVDALGRRHVFVATCADPSQIHLAEGQTIVSPGLIYGLEQPVS